MRGNLQEGRRLTAAVLTRDVTDEVRVRMYAVHAAMAFAQGDLDGAADWQRGADLARSTDDLVGLGHCVAGVGLVALAQGDLPGAEREFAETIELCEQVDRTGEWMWTLAHVWLATVRLLRGDTAGARPLLVRARDAAARRHDPLAGYIALFTSAQVELADGQPARAREHLEEGIRLSTDTGDLANLAYFLETLGVVEAQAHEWRRVALLHGAALQLRDTVGADVYGYYTPDQAMLTMTLEAARAGLGGAFDETIAEGALLDVQSMVDLALQPA